MEVLCFIRYQMIINDLTGKVDYLGSFFLGGQNSFSPFFIFVRVLYRKLGLHDTEDVPVFTESDSSYCVDITSTKDGKFITVNSNSRTSSEEGICILIFFFLLKI